MSHSYNLMFCEGTIGDHDTGVATVTSCHSGEHILEAVCFPVTVRPTKIRPPLYQALWCPWHDWMVTPYGRQLSTPVPSLWRDLTWPSLTRPGSPDSSWWRVGSMREVRGLDIAAAFVSFRPRSNLHVDRTDAVKSDLNKCELFKHVVWRYNDAWDTW